MHDAHVYEMQCKCGSQTPRVLQPSPLIKISSRDLISVPLLIEFLITFPQIIFSFPSCIAFTTLITPHDLVKLDHLTPSHSLPSVNYSDRCFFKSQIRFLLDIPQWNTLFRDAKTFLQLGYVKDIEDSTHLRR